MQWVNEMKLQKVSMNLHAMLRLGLRDRNGRYFEI